MAVDITTIGIEMDTTSVKAGIADMDKAAISGKKMADSIDKTSSRVAQSNEKQEQSYRDLAKEAVASAKQQEVAASKAATKMQQESERAAKAAQNQTRGVMQNLGWQTQDAIVQLQMGTKMSTVFSQQGSQLASAWNPMLGLFVAVAGVVGGALAAAFSGASETTEELSDRIKELNKDFKNLDANQKKFLMNQQTEVQGGLTDQLKEQGEEIERLISKIAQAKSNLAAGGGRVGGTTMGQGSGLATTQADVLKYEKELDAARASLSTTNQALFQSIEQLNNINGISAEADKDRIKTVKELISSLEDQKAALNLSGEAMADYIATKAKATGEDAERIKTLYLDIEAIEQRTAADKKAEQIAEQKRKQEEQRGKSIQTMIKMMEREADLFGVTSKAAQIEYDIKNGLIEVQGGLNGAEAQALIIGAQRIDQLNAQKSATDEYIESLDYDKLINGIDSIGGAWSRTGSVIVDAFGDITDAMGDYLSHLDQIAIQEQELADYREKHINNPEAMRKAQAAEMKLNKEKTSAQISGFKSIAGAASNMFGEQSKGRKALHALETGFATVEMGLVIQKSILAAKEAVLTQGKGDPYTAFARMAAMAAIVGGLGYAVGNVGGGGGTSAASVQQKQGTGSVLGGGKSESFQSAFDEYADIGLEQLAELRGIRDALTVLGGGIDKLSIGVITSGLTDQKYINLAPQYVGDITRTGQIQTFGARKRDIKAREQLAPLGSQIAEIFGYIDDTVGEAIKSLGLTAENPVWAFVSNIGKISFKDMTGEEIQSELNAIFGQQADLITEFVVPAMKEYQQIGEGLFETLTRVAKEMAVFNYYTDALGVSFDATGLSAIAIQQNVAELSGGMDKLADNLKTYYEEFYSEQERSAKQMELLTAEMKHLGYDIVPASREAFRNLVESIDLSTDAGQRQFAGLMSLSEAFSDLVPATEDLTSAQRDAADIAQERAGLERQLMQLNGETQKLRELDLAALDESNQALQLQIWAIQDQAAASREAEAAARQLAQAQEAIANQRYNLETQLLTLQGNTDELRARELAKLDESNRGLQEQIWMLEDQKLAADEAAKAQEQAIEDARRAADEQRRLAQGVYDSISGALKALMGESETLKQMTQAQAQSTLVGALSVAKRGGSLVGYAGLEDALKAIQQIDKGSFGSSFEYNRAIGQNIGLLSELEKYTRVDGSHANGLDYVPFDGYVAKLHRGERVQTAGEASSQADLVREVRMLRDELKAGNISQSTNLLLLRKTIDKWDGDGMPLERAE